MSNIQLGKVTSKQSYGRRRFGLARERLSECRERREREGQGEGDQRRVLEVGLYLGIL